MNHSAHRQFPYLFSVVLIVGLIFAQNASAAITVCSSGCAYTSIQAAVSAAPSGETIRVLAGVYVGQVVVTNKNLTIRGDGANLTVVDRGPASVSPAPPAFELDCTSNFQITIADLTITGGVPVEGFGGGGLENNGCTVNLNNSVITNNASDGVGGIYNDGAMTVRNSTIINNNNRLGGGGISNSGTLTLISSFVGDNGTRTPGKGGGIENGGTLVVRNSTITNNYGPDGGGFANTVSGKAQFIDSIVANNSAYGEGGGLWNVGVLSLTRTIVIGNETGNQGGGIWNKAVGTLTLKGSTIINNKSGVNGGGVYTDGATTVAGTIIKNNTPNNCGGVGYACP